MPSKTPSAIGAGGSRILTNFVVLASRRCTYPPFPGSRQGSSSPSSAPSPGCPGGLLPIPRKPFYGKRLDQSFSLLLGHLRCQDGTRPAIAASPQFLAMEATRSRLRAGRSLLRAVNED